MTELSPQIGVLIQNDSGKVIPSRSVVVVLYDEITTATDTNESTLIVHVDQYHGQDGNILVTGRSPIRAGDTGDGGWTSSKSFGRAYSDQRIYVSIDQSIDLPTQGEEWGPTIGEWFITRGGKGFFADGYNPLLGSGSGSGSGDGNIDPSRAIFMRGTALTTHLGMIRSTVVPGSLDIPTTLKFDVWVPTDFVIGTTLWSYAVTTKKELLGMTVVNRQCFSVTTPGSGSEGGSGSVNISVPGRIEWNAEASEWLLVEIMRCKQVATSVVCNGNSLTVTYENISA